MDLLNLEKEDTYENKNPPYTCEEWEKMAGHDPAGTMGMKPPEVNNRDTLYYVCYLSILQRVKAKPQMLYVFKNLYLFYKYILYKNLFI